MIVSAPLAPLYPAIQSSITGLAGAGLGLTLYTGSGAVQTAHITTPFTEIASPSGAYVCTSGSYLAPSGVGPYRLVWDNGGAFLADEDVLVSSAVQYFDTAPSASLPLDYDSGGQTGLVGTIGLTLYTVAGAVQTARTTAHINETPAGSGFYFLTSAYLAPSSPGKYLAVWDNGGTFAALQDVYIGVPTPTGGASFLGGLAITGTMTKYSRQQPITRYSRPPAITRYSRSAKTRYSYTSVGIHG